MKKVFRKIINDIQYKKFMWTCEKVVNPQASFFQRLSAYRVIMKEAKTAKIQRIDNIEEYMKKETTLEEIRDHHPDKNKL